MFQNLGTTLGLLKAIALMLRVCPEGLLYGGIPCCSFGFLSSPTHGRGALCPWGNPFPFVYMGNILSTRFALLAVIGIIRGCVWACEQPEKTTITHLPPMELLMRSYLRPLMAKWFCPQCHIECDFVLMMLQQCHDHEDFCLVSGPLWAT